MILRKWRNKSLHRDLVQLWVFSASLTRFLIFLLPTGRINIGLVITRLSIMHLLEALWRQVPDDMCRKPWAS